MGVGGHCIAVDPWFIVAENEDDTEIIQAARHVNLSKTDWVVKKIHSLMETKGQEDTTKFRIGCLGITFKPDVDDIRESPALEVVKKLVASGNNVMVVDPNVSEDITFELFNLETVLRDADILVILVKHKEFIELRDSFPTIPKTVLDFCGALNKDKKEYSC